MGHGKMAELVLSPSTDETGEPRRPGVYSEWLGVGSASQP
jgi:hypothetical protein